MSSQEQFDKNIENDDKMFSADPEAVFSVRPASINNLPITKNIKDDEKENTVVKIPTSIEELKNYCEYKRDLHYICSKYYEKWSFRFQIPSIFITSISGIMSFFATSSVFSEQSIQFLSLLVGVCASSSAVVQAVSNIFDFGDKASSHEYAVMSYDQILTKIRFMILKGNPDSPNNIELIERLIFELKQRCKYITPSWAEERYNINKHKFKSHLIKLKKKDIIFEKQFEEMKEIENLKFDLFQKDVRNIKNIEDLKNKKIYD